MGLKELLLLQHGQCCSGVGCSPLRFRETWLCIPAQRTCPWPEAEEGAQWTPSFSVETRSGDTCSLLLGYKGLEAGALCHPKL